LVFLQLSLYAFWLTSTVTINGVKVSFNDAHSWLHGNQVKIQKENDAVRVKKGCPLENIF
jgi:hypothetical protein